MKLIPNSNYIAFCLCIILSSQLFACSSSGSPDTSSTDTSADLATATGGTNGESDNSGGGETGGVTTAGSAGVECTASTRVVTDDVPYVGNIFRPTTPSDERFHMLWNQVTPENSGKWFNVEASRDLMTWDVLDDAINYASDFNYTFKLHTLIAGQNTPTWIEGLSAAEQEEEIIEWFDEVSTRYPDIQQVDVVSEPVSEQPSYKDALGGDGDTGWDWVIRAFELARTRFPNSELILNDYKVSATDETGPAFLELVALLQARGLVDGVGVEGHFLEETDAVTIQAKLDKLVALDIPIYLSDLDINEADDQVQLEKIQALFPVFFDNTAVKGLTFWGYRENQLWRVFIFIGALPMVSVQPLPF